MKIADEIRNLGKNPEVKKLLSKVKKAQSQLEVMLKDKTWVDEAKKYADKQSKEVKKLIGADAEKVRAFLEKERKEFEKFQKQIPGEVQKIRKFVDGQRKEFEKLIRKMGKLRAAGKRKQPAGATTKKGGSKGSNATAST